MRSIQKPTVPRGPLASPPMDHEVVRSDPTREPVAIAELRALSDIDIALAPEHFDAAEFDASRALLDTTRTSDDLRLPPPPIRAPDGESLHRSLSRAVETFTRAGREPVRASKDDVVAEARMMSLLRGVNALEHEIRVRMAECRLA